MKFNLQPIKLAESLKVRPQEAGSCPHSQSPNSLPTRLVLRLAPTGLVPPGFARLGGLVVRLAPPARQLIPTQHLQNRINTNNFIPLCNEHL
jgi:hypothetical protein